MTNKDVNRITVVELHTTQGFTVQFIIVGIIG